ncbi:MAG: polysaccharide deacetylase family protein [Oscillospiraceae bacterium]|nr:polysaccharide deacetylase family protein [Oscillospiraceae bacterium]
MFVYTVTKKRAIRMLLLAIAIIAGIAIGIAAILTAISSGADERKLPVYQVERADNKLSLTFNCAWGNSNTDELLKILDKENIKATFFVTGEFCDKYPEDVLKIFKAGHEIQSHSDKHPHVEGANINDFILDTKQAEQKIEKITGVKPTLYRAPYGEYDNNSIFTINGMGYKYIQWSVDSIDWQEPNASTIVKRVTNGAQSGSIVLFHNDLANTTEALPEVISSLKGKGFDFVTVSELIYWENYRIDHSGKQIFDGSANEQIHTAGTQVNAAFEILLDNLTIEEIMSLENGISPELGRKLSNVLTKEQISAVTALSNEELQSAWSSLVEAKITGQTGILESSNTTAVTPAVNNNELEGDKIAVTDQVGGNQGVQTAATTTSAVTTAQPVTTGEVNEANATETTLPELEPKGG